VLEEMIVNSSGRGQRMGAHKAGKDRIVLEKTGYGEIESSKL